MSTEPDVQCDACSARNPAGATRCWVCGEALAPAAVAARPPPLPPRPRRSRWKEVEEPPPPVAAWLVAMLVLGALFVSAPGLAVLLALCGVPILLAYGNRAGLAGCVLSACMSGGILVASVVAWFITCSAIGGRGLGSDEGAIAGLVVGGAVFVGLTVLAVLLVRGHGRRRSPARPGRYEGPA